MRWINLQPITHSEVSQGNKYHILTRIHGIQKDGGDEPICRQQWRCGHREQTYGHGRGERVGRTERATWKLTRHKVDTRQPVGICRAAQGTQEGWEVGGRLKRARTYVNLRPIHVDGWRKPTRYCNHPSIKNKN